MYQYQNLMRCFFSDIKSDKCQKFKLKICCVAEFLIANLTRCTIFRSKSDQTKKFNINLIRSETLISKSNALYFFEFTIWRVLFESIQNLRCRNFFFQKPLGCIHINSKFEMYWNFTQNLSLYKALKMQNMSFYGVKEWNVVFCKQFFLEYDISKSFKFKIRCVAFFQNKIRHVSEFFVQNLTRCTSFRSKCDQTRNFHFTIWRVVKCSGQNLTGCVLLISKLMRCLFHQFKVWHNVKFLTRYLTRQKMSFFKIWCVVKLFF